MFVPAAYGRGPPAFGPNVIPGFVPGPGPVVIMPGFNPPVMNPVTHEREPVDLCKLFVGGLNPATTEEDLEEYMKQFGHVKSTTIMFDRKNKRSRCFGFVSFDAEKELLKCFNSGPHTIAGQTVELRRAVPRTTVPPFVRGPPGHIRTPQEFGEADEDRDCKVFVGGVPQSMTTDEIKTFFSERFGAVKQVDFFYDKSTGRMRGFGFIIFNFPHSAKAAIGHHNIGDVTVEVKRAMEREALRQRMDMEGPIDQKERPGRRMGGPRPATAAAGPYPYRMYPPVEITGQFAAPTPGAPITRIALQDPYAAQAVAYTPYAASYVPEQAYAAVTAGSNLSPQYYLPPQSSLYATAVDGGLPPSAVDPYELAQPQQNPPVVRGRPKPSSRAHPY